MENTDSTVVVTPTELVVMTKLEKLYGTYYNFFMGQYFGKKGQVLDRYGANLAAAALLGHGHIVLHKKNSNPFCRQ